MRLIDTDEILTRIQKAYVDTDFGTDKRAIAINIGLTKALNNVQDCKKIEWKKGKWIYRPEIGWGEAWVCSECEEITQSAIMGKPRYNFCPMCGADMRGETDE